MFLFGFYTLIMVPSVLAVMNIFWFWKIAKGMIKTLTKAKHNKGAWQCTLNIVSWHGQQLFYGTVTENTFVLTWNCKIYFNCIFWNLKYSIEILSVSKYDLNHFLSFFYWLVDKLEGSNLWKMLVINYAWESVVVIFMENENKLFSFHYWL